MNRSWNISFKSTLLTGFMVVVSMYYYAQDFHLSQYEASPMILNPAMTGQFKGDHRATMHYRSQWSSIISNPFKSMALSYDTKFNKFSLGGYLHHTTAGQGTYTSITMVLSAAYDYKFKNKPHNHLVGGLQLGGINKSVNFNVLTFEDQYDPANGGTFTNSTAESFGVGSTFIPEVNFGLMYYYTNTSKRINPFLGISGMHLTQPNETLFSSNSKLPMRINVHPGIKVFISDRFSFLIDGLAMQQENILELVFGWKGYYHFENKDAIASYGVSRRTNNDAIIAHLGLKYNKFLYKLSYDLNTSNLQSISNNRGGFELSITYISSKINPIPIRTCPDL
ncbi:MAG: PorP/SprF family type IX secretion system membrane protein [Flavobacteriales bacterium]|nr:PorP/SprF family type IX secretion system membrane protein [Flavobacteriales bacterium]